MAHIAIENFSFSYPKTRENIETKKVLNNISLTIEEGEFFLICGPSGCGKSTLLKNFKKEIAPHGKKTGEILYVGTNIPDLDDRVSVSEIGFVMQNPDNQIVTDKVWNELAFGLESLGLPNEVINLRVAEMASFFGIHDWFRKDIEKLSGGQKQMLNLASVMAMQPKILILDEPTSQLDPIAATEFLETVARINRDFGITVIISEHRLEEVFPLADRVAIMDEGEFLNISPPREITKTKDVKHLKMFSAFPTPVKVFSSVNKDMSVPTPITIREGRHWLRENYNSTSPCFYFKKPVESDIILSLENIWFRYDRDSADILRGVNLDLKSGEIFALLGGNGTGKTTCLNVAAGLFSPYRGKIKIMDKNIKKQKNLYNGLLTVLPQNPQTLFTQDTVKKDLFELVDKNNKAGEEKVLELAEQFGILDLFNRHPFDLSGGEQQKVAFTKILLTEPKIVLLDEPTKGLDSDFKIQFAEILNMLTDRGIGIIMATHDIEFAAEYSDRCALLFDGTVVSSSPPRKFFSGNSYYTTAANRMARDICKTAVTSKDVITLCEKPS